VPFTRSGDIDIHYAVEGDGPETLLLVNGVGDDLAAWGGQLPDLLAAGLRVVTFDNRGVGRSGQPPGPYTSGQMARDTRAVVEALRLGPFHLAGVSMGGAIAIEYALAYPDDLRSVVLANTYATPDPFTRDAFEAWGLVAEAAGIPTLMRAMAPWIFSPAFYEREPATVARFLVEMQASVQPAASFVSQIGALTSQDAAARVGAIRTPALVLVADDDIIIRPALSRRLFDALPNATWASVPGGHAAFWEDPGPWNRALISFVAAHAAPPR
jgi:3-oxoadipate enol-lactonase